MRPLKAANGIGQLFARELECCNKGEGLSQRPAALPGRSAPPGRPVAEAKKAPPAARHTDEVGAPAPG
jgi:hypothetical protein